LIRICLFVSRITKKLRTNFHETAGIDIHVPQSIPKFPENPSTEELIKFWKLMDKFRDLDYVPAARRRGDCSEGMHSTKCHLVFPGYCHMSIMTLYFTFSHLLVVTLLTSFQLAEQPKIFSTPTLE